MRETKNVLSATVNEICFCVDLGYLGGPPDLPVQINFAFEPKTENATNQTVNKVTE